MGMESTSLSRSLRGLETMGWIERRPDPMDKRMVRVYLTQTGIAARREARDLVITVNQRLRDLLGGDAVDRLLHEIKRLNEVLDQPDVLISTQPPILDNRT